jgi:hypothetical protein
LEKLVATSIFGLFLAIGTGALARGGRTNSEGCHNEKATGGYHCHSSGSVRSDNNNSALSSSSMPVKNEKYYNTLLAEELNGVTESSHNFTFEGGRSAIRVDVETAEYVIEGGLDKRSSLDSLQQIVFAAFLTKKKPAVVIYDTDGVEGPYEFRIRNAAESVGVTFFRLNENQVRNLKTPNF